MTVDLDHLRRWIGRTEERTDVVTASPLARLAATLDRDDPPPRPGDPAPPGAHWLFFLDDQRQSELGADGHPRRGRFLPPVPLARRMWAGDRMTFHRPMRVGEEIRRTSTVTDVRLKESRVGPLVFVTVRHQVSAAGEPSVVEEHDLVFRQPPDPAEPPPPPRPAPGEAVWRRTIHPDPVLLFRFSALTFNGHRIHYDRAYATGDEGYPGLLVHGPLTATLLLDLCRRELPQARISRFECRAVRPILDTGPFTVAGRPDGQSAELWALDSDGALAMTADVEFG